MKPIALTTPLFYVNDVPHIGSAYPTIAADALARFYRLRGHPVRFITGTDEHGQKIERTAQKLGVTTEAHCDRIVLAFKELWQKLDISYDRFIRTREEKHHRIVTEFFGRVWERGDIYLSRQQGWYCVACEEFKEEREMTEGHYCLIHPTVQCEWRDEANYFFALSKYQSALEEFHAQHPEFVQPEMRRNEVLSFIKQGLKDFSISRLHIQNGFPVPIDPQHTLYVWFDALLGYITALLAEEDEPHLTNATKYWYPIHLHIIGKDILRFHAIYFPAMLMSAGLEISGGVFGHGLLTKDGLKMGKTLGNTIDPYQLVDKYGASAVRYFFLKEIDFGKDGDFSEERFISIINADLANSLGNLLNRTLGMTHKYCQGQVPKPVASGVHSAVTELVSMAKNLGDRAAESYMRLDFRAVCESILHLIWSGNKLIDATTPWKLFKEGQQAEVNEVLYTILEAVRLAGFLLFPITPQLSQKIYQQLHLSWTADHAPDWGHAHWGILPVGQALPEPVPIFQRVG
ncbi:MAG: methionine--tRNA ligase [Pseudanabaenaceae cyanobacterium]